MCKTKVIPKRESEAKATLLKQRDSALKYQRSFDEFDSQARDLVADNPDKRCLRHVAIIMDGNGRWAEKRGLKREAGHRAGIASARRAIEFSKKIGLTHLTLYSFSTENWKRPPYEVRSLMSLMAEFIESDLGELKRKNIRIRILGDKVHLPPKVKRLVHLAETETRDNNGYILQIAFNYGGRDEILRAVKKFAYGVKEGKIDPENITEETFGLALDTGDGPAPDLIIRTSGEMRTSNFLLWQSAYAEYVFLDEYWPDFDQHLFSKAIDEFAARRRRFGE